MKKVWEYAHRTLRHFIESMMPDGASEDDRLPIHFFTLVLNGEPFIRYHEHVLSQLQVPWHWHIIEGVASLSHDTAWSVAAGGHIDLSFHHQGRSNDGTSAYLDDLSLRMADRITLYRKPPGVFWDGKREMCNAPLKNINTRSLLWQIDSDELWTAAQIHQVHDLFKKNPLHTGAAYWCQYFVGPKKIISTRYNYAQNPAQEWNRTWRFTPGDWWAAHEPPTLARKAPHRRSGLGEEKKFTQDQMENMGVIFQHFAYATEAQLRFKETYYGYAGALEKWELLQNHTGTGFLKDYFPWVTDECLFDEAMTLGVKPLAVLDGQQWTFVNIEKDENKPLINKDKPTIVVDGYFFQFPNSGISRVWLNLLRVWSHDDFGNQIFVLDRAGTAPRMAGLHYIPVEAFSYETVGSDAFKLQEICDRIEADLFLSTYYTFPLITPSIFIGHDMIPELFRLDLSEPMWREKHRAIEHASAHIMVSQSSAQDLERLMPCVAKGSTIVANCGVDPVFKPMPEDEIAQFIKFHDIAGPYILFVGDRTGPGGYKNGAIVFRALAQTPELKGFTLVCCGGCEPFESHLSDLGRDINCRVLRISDLDLAKAYSGAHALVYPSRYEGFGLPVLEAMSCGCPVITCQNSSLIEVAGKAAIFVNEDDPAELAARIINLQKIDVRSVLIEQGFVQASQFSFKKMASTIESVIKQTYHRILDQDLPLPNEKWGKIRESERNTEKAHFR